MDNEQTPALREAVENMENMREAYDNLSQAAEAYNTGKVELAQNLNAKGVTASATETLPELAGKVMAISQEPIIMNDGDLAHMYARQLFGVQSNDIVPGYWNLYDIMAQLLSDGRLVTYGGILLAEYYKGYDSLALSGAGAGGAYVVSDKDSDGNFIMYTNDTTHVWDTESDGKGNRWVAYCFADAGHGFDITDTNTSPRSIHIGRHVGLINCVVNSRISEIVVTDGNQLDDFNPSTFTHAFGKKLVFRNFNNNSYNLPATTFDSVYVETDAYSLRRYPTNRATAYIIKANSISGGTGNGDCVITSADGYPSTIIIQSETITAGSSTASVLYGLNQNTNLKELRLLGVEEMSGIQIIQLNNDSKLYVANFAKLYIGYKDNDKLRAVAFRERYHILTDVELQDGWCKPLTITDCTSLTKQNVQEHIFDRLGVNDLSTGTVTITLASAVLALFTQEEIDAVVERTNITIVGA